MKRKQIASVAFGLVGALFFFFIALYRSSEAFGVDPFSLKNILVTALVFIVVMSICYTLMKKNDD